MLQDISNGVMDIPATAVTAIVTVNCYVQWNRAIIKAARD